MGKRISDAKDLLRFYTNVQRYTGTISSKKWRIFVFALAMVVFYTVWEYQVMRFSPKQLCKLNVGDLCIIHSPDVSMETVCSNICNATMKSEVENICGPANLFYWFLAGVASGMILLIIIVEGETIIDLWSLMKLFKKEEELKTKGNAVKKGTKVKRGKG